MPAADFDMQPELLGRSIRLRPLRADDFDGLFTAAAHPEIWAGHPAKDRYEKGVFEGYFKFLLASESTLVIVDRQSGQIVGCSRYYRPPDRPESVAIGFTFLNHTYWGGATNHELKTLMLGHAFKTVQEVWFHIDPTNIRSQKATAKLGAEHVGDASLSLSGHEARWMCFRLSATAWEAARTGGAA